MIFGVEPVFGLHRHDVRAQLPRIAHKRAGLDAETLRRVARRNPHGGIRQRLHDDDGLAPQGRVFLLLARRKKGVEVFWANATSLAETAANNTPAAVTTRRLFLIFIASLCDLSLANYRARRPLAANC